MIERVNTFNSNRETIVSVSNNDDESVTHSSTSTSIHGMFLKMNYQKKKIFINGFKNMPLFR